MDFRKHNKYTQIPQIKAKNDRQITMVLFMLYRKKERGLPCSLKKTGSERDEVAQYVGGRREMSREGFTTTTSSQKISLTKTVTQRSSIFHSTS
jgi:hypothetical protein